MKLRFSIILCFTLLLLLFCGCTSELSLPGTSKTDAEGGGQVQDFKLLKVGDVFSFGSLNEEAPLLWRVLSVENENALIVTTEGVDCQLYNTQAIETEWETCSLRTWLNGDFLLNSFDSTERARLLATGDSRDKLFLLSVDEAETYFSSDEDRICKPTSLALKNGAYADPSTGACMWWLRTGGSSAERAALVNEVGTIDRSGDGVYCDGNAVRPAAWISLGSVSVSSADEGSNASSAPSVTTKKPSGEGKESFATGKESEYPTDEPLPRPIKREKIVNILVIGNSCAYYFMDELEGMAAARGFQVNVYNAYYSLSSGNQVDAHWANLTIHKNNTEINTYKFFKTAKGVRQQLGKSITLQNAVSYTDWDVIVMNESVRPRKCDTYRAMTRNTVEDAKRIYDYLKEHQPKASLFWYQGYSYELGWTASNDESEYMTTLERQKTNHENIKLASKLICQQNGIGLIPVGDAWQLARENPNFGQHLTERWQNGRHLEDHYHDGESGGQYLNACVFFEAIFQTSCVNNSFIPQAGGELEHKLTPEKIKQLQTIAHQTVAAVYGADFAK